MRCSRARRLASEAAAGGLPVAERARLERHLGHCASCRADFRQKQALWAALSRAPALPPRVAAEVEAVLAGAVASGERSGAAELGALLRALWRAAAPVVYGLMIVAGLAPLVAGRTGHSPASLLIVGAAAGGAASSVLRLASSRRGGSSAGARTLLVRMGLDPMRIAAGGLLAAVTGWVLGRPFPPAWGGVLGALAGGLVGGFLLAVGERRPLLAGLLAGLAGATLLAPVLALGAMPAPWTHLLLRAASGGSALLFGAVLGGRVAGLLRAGSR